MLANKKILLALAMVFVCAAVAFSQKFAGKTITVPEPDFKNAPEEESWVSAFIQGLLTDNFIKYSDMQVIDRKNLDRVMAEQKISQGAAYSEAQQLEVGKLVAAEYIIAVTIIKKGGSGYSVDYKVTDSQTGTAVASYSDPNCSVMNMENGVTAITASRELLLRMGVAESKLADLLPANSQTQSATVAGNLNTAKGIAAQRSGNLVEAMSYYSKQVGDASTISYAASKLNSLTQNLSGGSIRDYAREQVKMRNQWKKIWEDFGEYFNNNVPYVIYSTEINQGKIDYDKETVEVKATVADGINPDCEDLYNRLYGAYESLKTKRDANGVAPDVANWKLTTSFSTRYNVMVSLFDENKKMLGEAKYDVSARLSSFKATHELSAGTVSFTCPIESVTDGLSLKVVSDRKGGLIHDGK